MKQRERVLDALRIGRRYDTGITTAQFLQMGIPRFSARINELRSAGFGIETKRLKGSSYSFRLTHDPELDNQSTQTQMEV